MKIGNKLFQEARITLIGIVILGLGSWAFSAQAQERPKKTWKTIEEMSAEEIAKLQIDHRGSQETPRDPKVPYTPVEDFPFKPPYTGEEILYLADTNCPNFRWNLELIVNGETINTRGSLYENQGSAIFNYTTGKENYWDRAKKLKGGDVLQYLCAKYNMPPSNYGFALIEIEYKVVPGEGTKVADRWLYLPSIRKIRRVPSPRRDDVVPQYDFVFDDSIGRPPWEYDSRIIGVDTIYPEQFYRIPPQDRPWLIPLKWKVVKLPFRNMPVVGLPDPSVIEIAQYNYPDVSPDGGVMCYVIESIPKEDFLPGYYARRVLSWVTVKDKLLLRVELYDRKDGNLFFINEFRYHNWYPAQGKDGISRYMTHYWDIRIDHMSYVPYIYLPPPPQGRNYKLLFNPQRFLQVDQFDHPLNDFDFTLKDPHLVAMRPELWPDKFPQHRPKDKVMAYVTPEVQERIKRQDEAGRLVFE